jgi:hypothetical protein
VAGFYAFPGSPEAPLEEASPRARARQRGTQGASGELITHLALSAGWPSAMSAAKVVEQVVEEKRA